MIQLLIFSMIYKPVVIFFCSLLGVPHTAVIIFTLFISVIALIKKRIFKTKKLILGAILFLFPILFLNATLEINEYIYNFLFIMNFVILILLKDVIVLRKKIVFVWNASLLIVILITVGMLFVDHPSVVFENRATMVGYANPLWAARDLCICALFNLFQKNRLTVTIAVILAFMLFALQARGSVVSFALLAFYRGINLRILVLAPLLLLLVSALESINSYSLAYRLFEWGNILQNLDKIPLFGFGIRNYQYVDFTTNLYAHNWFLDLVVGLGVVGGFLGVLLIFQFELTMRTLRQHKINPIYVVPLVYFVNGLTQGSTISSMLGLVIVLILPQMHRLSDKHNAQT